MVGDGDKGGSFVDWLVMRTKVDPLLIGLFLSVSVSLTLALSLCPSLSFCLSVTAFFCVCRPVSLSEQFSLAGYEDKGGSFVHWLVMGWHRGSDEVRVCAARRHRGSDGVRVCVAVFPAAILQPPFYSKEYPK